MSGGPLAPAGRRWRRRETDERGQGLIEYAFILMFIALLLIVIVATLGTQVTAAFTNVSTQFP